jgi:hypothetical protein
MSDKQDHEKFEDTLKSKAKIDRHTVKNAGVEKANGELKTMGQDLLPIQGLET